MKAEGDSTGREMGVSRVGRRTEGRGKVDKGRRECDGAAYKMPQ